MLIAEDSERQRRLTRRALPLVGLAALAFLLGLLSGGLRDTGAERTARAFGEAWQRADYKAMYGLLTPDARRTITESAFTDAYRRAAATATATGYSIEGPDGEEGDAVRLPVDAETRIFGTVSGDVLVPVIDERIQWSRELTFPGLGAGGKLTRRTEAPQRGKVLASDGETLASGPAERREVSSIGGSIAGEVEAPENDAARNALYARGFERNVPVGQTGLERVFDEELAGKPGGELLAGGKVIARSAPRPGRDVRSTIDSGLQEAAVSALGERLGGIAVLDARTARVRALSGIAFSGPQPPGSTFKLITTTAALEDKLVTAKTNFPVETAAEIDGVSLENANGESCGGSFRNSFAHSCNSVFAPLGVRVGAKRLVEMSEKYGFNRPPGIPGAAASTLPKAGEIKSPLELGSTAIGQGKVLATPLLLASMAQTIAADGVRTQPTLRAGGPRPRRTRVTSPRIARQIGSFMVDVVGYGTGVNAKIPGVKVAGKTGTAELEDTRGPGASAGGASTTDAWFTAFAPAGRPKLVVAVLLVRSGAGGATAAPAAREVLVAGL